MSRSQAIRAKLIAGYRAEQDDHIAQITEGLLALEQGRGDPVGLLEHVFREAHSLKGAARALGLTVIEQLAHGIEDLLSAVRGASGVPTPEHTDLILRSLDACGTALAGVEAGESTPGLASLELVRALQTAQQALAGAPAGAAEAGPEARVANGPGAPGVAAPAEPEPALVPGSQTIRVAVAKLDALMEHMGEVVLAEIRAQQRLVDIAALQRLVSDWQQQWLQMTLAQHYLPETTSDPAVAPWLEFLERNRDSLGLLALQINALERQFNSDHMRLALVADALDDEVKRVRMLPLATITESFPRMVRDLARAGGKEVTLRLVGTAHELDKRVLERIKDPLVHLLRNAVDHGVEQPAVRARQGKPSDGLVTLAASTEGRHIVLRVSDDGAGLDLAAIGQRAVDRGLISPESLAEAGDEQIVELIFAPGLSTSPIISDVSGRGVGLDVVRHNLEELHGTVAVSFQPGHGTTFTLRLPLTLTSVHGLLVRAGGQVFALPLAVVERLLRFARESVASIEGQDAILLDERPVGLVRLADLLGLPATPRPLAGAADRELAVVLNVNDGVTSAGKRLALLVDELIGEQEIVMKRLTGPLVRVAGISGVTVLGTGHAVLTLNAVDLLRLAARATARTPVTSLLAEQAQRRRKTILVVDDSVTTRSLERNLLSAAGYHVRLAADGDEALASLVTEGPPDLVITDVLMPRLDGFTLTARLREDPRFRELPVILVTSLDTPADKARGVAVGADAYIVKGDFDQSNLLATIEQLI
jgi:two-component system chemotaxis sensor kinase CheA